METPEENRFLLEKPLKAKGSLHGKAAQNKDVVQSSHEMVESCNEAPAKDLANGKTNIIPLVPETSIQPGGRERSVEMVRSLEEGLRACFLTYHTLPTI